MLFLFSTFLHSRLFSSWYTDASTDAAQLAASPWTKRSANYEGEPPNGHALIYYAHLFIANDLENANDLEWWRLS